MSTFKAVKDTSSYDPETVALFTKRHSSETLTNALMTIPRRSRHHLPLIVPKDNQEFQQNEADIQSFYWKVCGSFVIWSKSFYLCFY